MTEHILFYGKGGVGTSTLIANISAAFSKANFKILQVGSDPTADTCSTLNGGFTIPTVSDVLRSKGRLELKEIIRYGFNGVGLMEIGDSETVGKIFETLQQEQIFEQIAADYVLYDLAGEKNFEAYYRILSRLGAHRIFVITSSDFMSLKAVNSIFNLLEQNSPEAAIPFGGLITNSVSSSFEDSFIADFARHTNSHVLGHVPRSLVVRQCELYGKTVIEAEPLSNQSFYYRRLSNQIFDIGRQLPIKSAPRAMSADDLRQWAREWADRLYALENGHVSDGAAI